MPGPMDGVSGANGSDAVAVAVAVKEKQQRNLAGQAAVRLIESACEQRPLPPDATFSTYA